MAPFLTAEWRDLVMLNYEVAPEALLGRVPAGTELDRFDGKTLVSVVGFRFLKTRVGGVPIPFHQDFDELNLRFYVRSQRAPERRGVVFVKEVVPRAAVTWVARSLYHENYHTHPMRRCVQAAGDDASYEYAFEAGGRSHALRATSAGAAAKLQPGSEAEFIAEHYYGYCRRRDGATVEYRVDHPSWLVHDVRDAALDLDVAAVYGPELAAALSGPPRSALIAVGSEVGVAAPVRLPA